MRGIRGRQDERLLLFILTRPQLAQPLDRARQRELGAAESFDEVTAAANAERLERAELAVHGAVPAGYPFATHAVARDDALPFEQELGESARVGSAGEELVRERPASLRRGDAGGALA